MEFTPEQIKDVFEKLLNETEQKFNTSFELVVFITKVVKQLTDTIKDKTLLHSEKVKLVAKIGETIVDDLEERTIINLEMANEVREVLRTTVATAEIFKEFDQTFEEIKKAASEATKNWGKIWNNCLTGFGCNKSLTVDEKATSKPMNALDAVMSVAQEDISDVIESSVESNTVVPEDSGKIEILEEETPVPEIRPVSPVVAEETVDKVTPIKSELPDEVSSRQIRGDC